MILVGYKIVFAAFWVFGRHWELTSSYLQMLPRKAIPATMLFLLFVRSGVTSPSATPSLSVNTSTTPAPTPSANDGGGSQGGVTPSPTATTTGAQTANVTASVFVADGKWNVVNPVSVYYYKGRTLFWRGGGGMKSKKPK